MPAYCFSVDFGDGRPFLFAEVSGIDAAVQDSLASPTGLRKIGNVTLKQGTGTSPSSFLQQVSENAIHRHTVTIRLIDEAGASLMTWTLHNAWPTKLASIDPASATNQTAIETLELACDAVTQTIAESLCRHPV